MGSVTTGRVRPAEQLGVELPVPIRVTEYRLRPGRTTQERLVPRAGGGRQPRLRRQVVRSFRPTTIPLSRWRMNHRPGSTTPKKIGVIATVAITAPGNPAAR